MGLTQDTNIPEKNGTYIVLPVAAATTIYAGAIVCINAAGFAVPGSAATGLKAVGRAEEQVKNPDEDGDKAITVKRGVFGYNNSAGADEITLKNIGDTCYIVDDCTVAKTSGTDDARSEAGIVMDVADCCVWVKM